jgi:hypothetical protein
MSSLKYLETPAAKRNRIMGLISKCSEELRNEAIPKNEMKDILACMILCFYEVEKTVSATITAWEKRDHWLKVEKFREEWEWISIVRIELESIYINDACVKAINLNNHLDEHLKKLRVPKIKTDNFWLGCSERIKIKKGWS